MLSPKLFSALGAVIDGFPRLPLVEVPYFRAMLVMQEQIMRASEDLLFIASAHHPYLAKHVEEEKGHHRWIVEDLVHLDVVAEREPRNYLVAQMVGMQYYHLLCGEPMAFFGYLAFLEGYPAARDTIERLKVHFPRSMRTAEFHALHDVEHRQELIQVIDTLPEKYHDCIIENACESAELYKTALWRMIAQEN